MGTIALIDDVTIFAIVIIALGIGIAANNIDRTLSRSRKRKKEEIERNPQPNPAPERIPVDPNCNEKKKQETCENTSPYSSYAKCSDLDTQQGNRYIYNTAEDAYGTLVGNYKVAGNSIESVTKISGSSTRSLGADANSGPCALAIYGTSHWNVLDKNRPGNKSIGSITRCECCYNTSTGPKIRMNYKNYAIFPKPENWRPYN